MLNQLFEWHQRIQIDADPATIAFSVFATMLLGALMLGACAVIRPQKEPPGKEKVLQ